MKLKIKNKKILMIGAGGIGMSALSRLYKHYGAKVTGYDDNCGEIICELKNEGIKILSSPNVNLKDFDEIVYSGGISKKHHLLKKVFSMKLPAVSRGDALARILNSTNSIAVTGSHGKTSVSLMIGSLLKESSYDPVIYAGGIDLKHKSNFIKGKGTNIVAELDESDGTFLKASPVTTIITNLDHEHVTKYKSLNVLVKTFSTFLKGLKSNSTLIINGDDKILKKISRFNFKGRKLLLCGKSKQCNDYYYSIIKSLKTGMVFTVSNGKKKWMLKTPLFGEHNALNITLMFALSQELGLKITDVKKAVSRFKGVKRRFERIFDNEKGGEWYSDYGHHPTELNAVIDALKPSLKKKKLIAVFEPHRFSRLLCFFDQFVNALKKADEVIISDIYKTTEKGDQKKLINKIINEIGPKKTTWVTNKVVFDYLKNVYLKDEIVVVFSAGILDGILRNELKAKTGNLKSLFKNDYFNNALKSLGKRLKRNVDMKKFSGFKTGGKCDFMFIPEGIDELINCLLIFKKARMQLNVIGEGTNILVSDKGVRGVIIKLNSKGFKGIIRHSKNLLECKCGERNSSILNYAIKNSLGGLEFLFGIPGSIGGSVKGNTGTGQGSIGDVLYKVEGLNYCGVKKEFYGKDLNIKYRKIIFPEDIIITKVYLKVKPGSAERINKRIGFIKESRKRVSPKGKTCGSVFKNLKNEKAWQIIDKLGLRGMENGHAKISMRHANWIINKGGAKSEDIWKLISKIQNSAKKNFNINLELELKLLGDF